MHDRTLLRIGSALAVVGSVIAIVAIILHPKIGEVDYGDFGYEESFLQTIADTPEWEIFHILVLFGALLLTGALFAVRRSIKREPGAAWAQLGFLSALLGAGLIVADVAIDGLAMKVVADSWAAAPPDDRVTFFRIGNSFVEIAIALFSIWVIVFWGITFILYGLAVMFSDVYPKLLGWIAAAAGSGGLVIGMVQVLSQPSELVSAVLFNVVAVILILWMLTMGAMMWRLSSATATD